MMSGIEFGPLGFLVCYFGAIGLVFLWLNFKANRKKKRLKKMQKHLDN